MKGFWSNEMVWKIPENGRQLHQRLSSFLFVILPIVGLSGFTYRFSRAVLGLEKEKVSWLLQVHEGSYIHGFEFIWVSCVTILVYSMAISGIRMLPWYKNLYP